MLVGKHGDHVGGELDAFRALQRGEVDACAMLDLNWETLDRGRHHRPGRATGSWRRPSGSTTASSPCGEDFDADRGAAVARRAVRDALRRSRAPRDDGPRRAQAWLPGRTSGFGPLAAAVDAERFFEREAKQA